MKILTDKKVALSHRCLLSFPKGVLPPSYLPQSLYLCGPRLQRPTVNKQRIRSSRGMRHSRGYNTLKEREQVGSPSVRALLCLCYTKFKGCVVRPTLTSPPKGFSAFRYQCLIKLKKIRLLLLKKESSIKGAEGSESCERKTMCQDLGFVLLPKSGKKKKGGPNWL